MQTTTLQMMLPEIASLQPTPIQPTSEINELKDMVKTLATQVKQLTDGRSNNFQQRRPYQLPAGRNNPRNQQGQGIVCFKCQQPGHYARECPAYPPPPPRMQAPPPPPPPVQPQVNANIATANANPPMNDQVTALITALSQHLN